MMVFAEASTQQLTFMFLTIVAALATALVMLFFALEQSARLMQLRTALIRRVDRRFGPTFKDGNH